MNGFIPIKLYELVVGARAFTKTIQQARVPSSAQITYTATFKFCGTQQRATYFQSQFSTYSQSITNKDWNYSALLEDKGKTATEKSQWKSSK